VLVSALCAAPLTVPDRTCGRLAAPIPLPESDTRTAAGCRTWVRPGFCRVDGCARILVPVLRT